MITAIKLDYIESIAAHRGLSSNLIRESCYVPLHVCYIICNHHRLTHPYRRVGVEPSSLVPLRMTMNMGTCRQS